LPPLGPLPGRAKSSASEWLHATFLVESTYAVVLNHIERPAPALDSVSLQKEYPTD